MLVYLVVFILSAALARIAESSWNRREDSSFPRGVTLGAILVGAVLVGVSALRWRVGTDYPTYEILFPHYVREVPDDLTLFGEPAFRIVAWLAMAINGDSATMFAIAAVITVGLSVGAIWRWSPAFSFGIAIYILSGAWTDSFNGIRQYCAGAILLAGHRHIIERNFFKWLLVVFIAMLFHVSAVVAILMYFVPTKKTSFRYQAVLVLIAVIGMFSIGFVMDYLVVVTGDADQWTGDYASRSVNPLRVAFALVPIAVFWIFNSRKAVRDAGGWFYINMLLVYGVTYVISLSSAMVARFAIYPLPFVAIGLAFATSLKNPRGRTILRTVLIIAYAVFFFLDISTTTDVSDFQWLFDRQ